MRRFNQEHRPEGGDEASRGFSWVPANGGPALVTRVYVERPGYLLLTMVRCRNWSLYAHRNRGRRQDESAEIPERWLRQSPLVDSSTLGHHSDPQTSSILSSRSVRLICMESSAATFSRITVHASRDIDCLSKHRQSTAMGIVPLDRKQYSIRMLIP